MSKVERQEGEGRAFKPQNIILLVLALVIVAAASVIILLQFDPAVAVVNGKKIKRSEVYAAMYKQGGRETLDSLILRQLVMQEARKCDVAVSEEDVDAEIDAIIGEHFMGQRDQFDSFLAQQGYTLEMIRDDARINIMARRIIGDDLKITETEAREYFTENQDDFNIPAEVKARHILVETEAEAQAVISRLGKGEDFAELAKELSKDTGTKDKGGDLGFFPPGDMVKEFEEVAFEQEDGQRSDPVKTVHGYHIIETLEHKEGREVPYEEVEEKVREALEDEKLPGLIQELIARLKDEALIDYRDK